MIGFPRRRGRAGPRVGPRGLPAVGGSDGRAVGAGPMTAEPVVASDLAELVLERATFDALVAHAWSDFPFEVCGLVGLRADGGAEVIPVANAERSMRYYVMDSRELLRAMRRIEDEELGLVIYHSHTHTQAYPSATDVRHAAYPEALYAIVTLQDRDEPVVRAFTIRDGVIAETPVVVRG
jgi:proteasome lid subunit RPN8/RPN11